MNRTIKRILTPEQARAVVRAAVSAYHHSPRLGRKGYSLPLVLAQELVARHGAPTGLDAITVAGELCETLLRRGSAKIPDNIDYLERLLLKHGENV